MVSGILRSGTIRLNQNLMLGPDKNGEYKQVSIKGIHIKRRNAPQATAG